MTEYSLEWYEHTGRIHAECNHPAPAHEDGSEPTSEETAAYERGAASVGGDVPIVAV